MLTDQEKAFFEKTAIQAGFLSKSGHGAIIVRDRTILSYGCERDLIKDNRWTVSAIYDAILKAHEDLSGCYIFISYFPVKEDISLIVASGITRVYFTGNVGDSESVQIINASASSANPLEIIKLEEY